MFGVSARYYSPHVPASDSSEGVDEALQDTIEEDVQSFVSQEGFENQFAFRVCKDVSQKNPLLKLHVLLETGAGSKNTIVIDSEMYTTDKEACYALIKHQMYSHVYGEERVAGKALLLGLVTALAYAIFSKIQAMYVASVVFKVSVVFSNAFSIFVFVTAVSFFFLRYRSIKNFDQAIITNSSDDELKGFRRILETEQQHFINIRAQSTFPSMEKFAISSKGNLWCMPPSHTSRLRKIEQELQQRGVVISDEEEDEKIATLLKVLSETESKADDDAIEPDAGES